MEWDLECGLLYKKSVFIDLVILNRSATCHFIFLQIQSWRSCCIWLFRSPPASKRIAIPGQSSLRVWDNVYVRTNHCCLLISCVTIHVAIETFWMQKVFWCMCVSELVSFKTDILCLLQHVTGIQENYSYWKWSNKSSLLKGRASSKSHLNLAFLAISDRAIWGRWYYFCK